MFRQADRTKRRLNSPAAARVRGVEVARGRGGFGFTLSGRAPCVLSCVLKGGPAHRAGLRPGDRVLSVDDTDVSQASLEHVVQLVGQSVSVLRLVVAGGDGGGLRDSCSSDEEPGFREVKGRWLRPKTDSKTLGISRAERVVAEMQSGGIFSMMLENSGASSSGSEKATAGGRPRRRSEPDFCRARSGSSKGNPDPLSEEETAGGVLGGDAVFADAADMRRGDPALDASALNAGVMVGYLGSIELASAQGSLESDSLQAIRGCMRRLRAEQKVHSLAMMRVARDRVRLCGDRGAVLASYPAHRLTFSAVCPDDRRFFGLVTAQAPDELGLNPEEDAGIRTSCHVFLVDPELCQHRAHQGIARRFGFQCTPDPDTGGCLQFPPTSQPVLQCVSALFRDPGGPAEGLRDRPFLDADPDGQQNNSDSGIGDFLPEEKSGRVLLLDLGTTPSRHAPGGPRDGPQAPGPQRNGYRYEPEARYRLAETPHADLAAQRSAMPPGSSRMEPPAPPPRAHRPQGKKAGGARGGAVLSGGQRWLQGHVLRHWRTGHGSDQESYAESTDGWSSANCSTLPPPMSKIPPDRYRAAGEVAQRPRPGSQRDEWARKLFGADKAFREKLQGKQSRDGEKKGSRFRGVTVGFPHLPQRASGRRSFGRSKRLSLARSLDDLEVL